MKMQKENSSDKYISVRQELIKRLEQKSFISEQNNMLVYKMHDISQKNEFKWKKHLTLRDMFKKVKDCYTTKSNNSGSHCSASRTFLVNNMLISVFNYRIFMCSHFFWAKEPKSRKSPKPETLWSHAFWIMGPKPYMTISTEVYETTTLLLSPLVTECC
jgi:hypothetical protein